MRLVCRRLTLINQVAFSVRMYAILREFSFPCLFSWGSGERESLIVLCVGTRGKSYFYDTERERERERSLVLD